jgi:hypothetical protein
LCGSLVASQHAPSYSPPAWWGWSVRGRYSLLVAAPRSLRNTACWRHTHVDHSPAIFAASATGSATQQTRPWLWAPSARAGQCTPLCDCRMCRTGPREQVDSPAQSQLVAEKQFPNGSKSRQQTIPAACVKALCGSLVASQHAPRYPPAAWWGWSVHGLYSLLVAAPSSLRNTAR